MKPDTKITIIFRHGVVQTTTRDYRKDELSQSAVEQPIWSFAWTDANANAQARVRLDEEGVSWLRGHHSAGSKEVAATRTAQALVPAKRERPALANPHVSHLAQAVGAIAARVTEHLLSKRSSP